MTERKGGLSIFGKSEVGKPEAAPGSGGGIMQHFSKAVERRAPDVPVARPVAPIPARVPTPPPEPEVRFPMWCAVTGNPFIVIARREGDTLHMLRNEAMPKGKGGGSPPPLLGAFGFDYRKWPGCYHCAAKDNGFWQCSRPRCGGPFHCTGDIAGRTRCACGIVERRSFYQADIFDVHGAEHEAARATAATPSAPPSLPAASNPMLRLGRK